MVIIMKNFMPVHNNNIRIDINKSVVHEFKYKISKIKARSIWAKCVHHTNNKVNSVINSF